MIQGESSGEIGDELARNLIPDLVVDHAAIRAIRVIRGRPALTNEEIAFLRRT